MIKVILGILGAYYAAKYIKNIWLAVPMAVVLALISNIVVTIILVQLSSVVDSETAIYAMIAGLVWYPVIAIIAFIIFRISKKKEAVEPVTNEVNGKDKSGKDKYGVDFVSPKGSSTQKYDNSSSGQQDKGKYNFCTQCGEKASTGDKFCGNCGGKLEVENKLTAVGVQKVTDDTSDSYDTAVVEYVEINKPKSIDGIIINTKPEGMNLLIDGRHITGTTPKIINKPRSPFMVDFVYNNELISTKEYSLSSNENSIFEDFTELLRNGFNSHPGKVKDTDVRGEDPILIKLTDENKISAFVKTDKGQRVVRCMAFAKDELKNKDLYLINNMMKFMKSWDDEAYNFLFIILYERVCQLGLGKLNLYYSNEQKIRSLLQSFKLSTYFELDGKSIGILDDVLGKNDNGL